MRTLGIGVIGCGEIAFTYHLPALTRLPQAEVVAVTSKSAESARKAAETFGAATWYATTDALLADPGVEAVLILTPNHTHVDLVQAAAEAKKPMLVQKPLGRDVEECRAILEIVRQADVLMVPSFMHRYLPEVIKARELLRQGLIGSIRMIRMRNATPGASWTSWFFQRQLVGGGAAIDIGVHGIDLIRWLVGEIDQVYAKTRQMINKRVINGREVFPDNEDTVAAIYEMSNGALCVHEITWAEYNGYFRFEMELYGEDGSILIRSGMGPLAVSSRHLQPSKQWVLPDLPQCFLGEVHHQDFVNAVLYGPSALTARPEDGLVSVQICQKIYESASTGKAIRVTGDQT